MYLYHVHSTAWSCLTQSTFINKSSNTLLSVEPFFRRCGGASTFYTLQISSAHFPSTKTESKPSPCHFLPATSGSTVPFALAWHVGRRWDLGEGQRQGMTVRRHEVPRYNFVWELLPSLAKCWKFLLLIHSLHTLTYWSTWLYYYACTIWLPVHIIQ